MSFEFRLEVWEKEEKKEDLLSCGTLNILQELFELKASTKPYWLDDPNLYLKLFINKQFHIPEIITIKHEDKIKGFNEMVKMI